MANRYWIGANTNWDDTSNWSATSGGSGGETVPTSVDDVYFDVNSFGTTTTVSLVVGAGSAICKDFIWDGFAQTPTFTAGYGDSLEVYGSFQLASNMTWNASSSSLYFKGVSTHTITTQDKTLNATVYFQGTGTYTVQDKLGMSYYPQRTLKFYSGTLDLNEKILDVGGVTFYGSDAKTFKMNGATISFHGSTCTWDETSGSNITFEANEFTNVEASNSTGSSVTVNWKGNGNTFGGSLNVKNTTKDETFKIYGNNTFHTINIQGDIADAGVTKTLQLEAGYTQNVTSFYAKGTSADYVNISSLTSGSQGYLSKTFGSSVCDYISLKDCGGRGGAIWWAGINSQDLGNNA